MGKLIGLMLDIRGATIKKPVMSPQGHILQGYANLNIVFYDTHFCQII